MKILLWLGAFLCPWLMNCTASREMVADSGPPYFPEFTIPAFSDPNLEFKAIIVGTSPFACADTYCFQSGGSVVSGRGGLSKPMSIRMIRDRQVSDETWTWRLERSDDPYVTDLDQLIVQEPSVACPNFPVNLLDPSTGYRTGPVMPSRTGNLACAMARVHDLAKKLYPNQKLPPVDISVTVVPFGFRAHRTWILRSSKTIRLHYFVTLEAAGFLHTAILAQYVFNEMTHAYSATGKMPWGKVDPWNDDDPQNMSTRVGEEYLGLAMGICALAAVDGRDTRYTFQLQTAQGEQSKAMGVAIGDDRDIKNTAEPGVDRAERILVDNYRARNSGSAEYDGANPQNVEALFSICRDLAASSSLPSVTTP